MSHAGGYDYDESDELPAGCEYADAQLARIHGADSRLEGSQAQVQIVCKPVPARRADMDRNSVAPQQSSGRKVLHFEIGVAWLAIIFLFSNLVCFVLGFFVAVADERRVRNIRAAVSACRNGGFVSGLWPTTQWAGPWRVS